ncbi:MAG TPA: FAD-dependent oxidoreductase [Beijerinckiaceae bacterium]|jgi:hypothetical protein
MHVAVLGGGLQGCCAALALAERGVKVTLFDRNDALLSRAAVANEGKIHLGYMYAGDPTLSTARTMIAGALSFAPFLVRHLGWRPEDLAVSMPAAYVVHRDSQQGPGLVARYLTAVHGLIGEAATGRTGAYFGMDLSAPPRPWSAAELEAEFDPAIALAAFDTPEVAINPVAVAHALRECVSDHPRIEVLLGRTVVRTEDAGERISVLSDGTDGPSRDSFDHAVNALWDGRLAVNDATGLPANRPWLHRLKYGVSFRLPSGAASPPSATFVLGPFGEVVSYGDGLTYLTWYPECLQGISTDLLPPPWATYPAEPLRSRVLAGTFRALSEIVGSLRGLDPETLPDTCVKGGVIVAWGQTDIYDPASELHRRYEIGVTSSGRFHSVDPGKLTMAPYFADLCARRIKP